MFPHQTCVYTHVLSHLCRTLRPSCPPLHHHPKTTCSVQITKPLTVQLSPVSHYFLTLLPFLNPPVSNALTLFFPQCQVQMYILITITITKSACININSDISCVFYMIWRHAEGGSRKAKVTTNQHLSCTIKTSQC
jgi:hypothetical protein